MSLNLNKSETLASQARKVLVGGVNSPVRSFARMGNFPVFAARGQGAHIWDADGNKYIDLVMSYGPHLFGHAHTKITEAVSGALLGSTCLGMSSEVEILWAQQLLKRLPWAQKVRAVSTGTEATQTAIRLARGATNRDVIVKFSGNYHGHVDSLLVDAGSGLATHSGQAVPECQGVPASLAGLSRVLPYNNPDLVKALFEKEGTKIAGIILEPIVGNMGVIPPKKEFLQTLRDVCTKHGALLIFDEVMCGLRIHRQSSFGVWNITPDLGCYGKIIGGGLPLAAVAGPAQWMDHLSPIGKVYQAGTLSGNPISVAAGRAMMDLIDQEDPYPRLEKFGADLEKVFYGVAEQNKIEIRVERLASMMSVFFRKDPVVDADTARACDQERFKKFFWLMLEEGIMLPPSPFEAFFLSTAHVDLGVGEFESRLSKVFKKLVS